MSTLRQQWVSENEPPAGRPPEGESGGCFLEDLCVLSFEGSDAATFLQGYLTCDTQTLTPDRLQAWALCNLKGRVVANGWGYAVAPERIDLLVHVTLAQALQGFFKPYLMFAKTELVSRADSVLVFG